MAKLTARQREAVLALVKTRVKLDNKLNQQVLRLFRANISQIRQTLTHSGYLPSFFEFENALRVVLSQHYRRVYRLFRTFTRDMLGLNIKAVTISSDPRKIKRLSIDGRIKERLDRLFAGRSATQAARIRKTLLDELQRMYIYATQTTTLADVSMSRHDLAVMITDTYRSRMASKANRIAITETTYATELTKQTEAEELANEFNADDFDVEDLDELDMDMLEEAAEEGNEDAEAILEEVEDAVAAAGDGEGGIDEGLLDLAASAAVVAAGITITKTWVATLDDVTRETHAEADGQEVSIDEPFSVGGDELMFPGDDGSPEETINCRCTLVYGIS